AYNADFDGDQMAVHVPLLIDAQIEARVLMMASNNILKPADGRPICNPTQDMTIGIFYLTVEHPERENYPTRVIDLSNHKNWGEILLSSDRFMNFKIAQDVFDDKKLLVLEHGTIVDCKEVVEKLNDSKVSNLTVFSPPVFSNINEAINASETNGFNLQYPVFIHRAAFSEEKIQNLLGPKNSENRNSHYLKTTIGRIIFNNALPHGVPFQNTAIRKETIANLIKNIFNSCSLRQVGETLDQLKDMGFKYATLSGLTISIVDMVNPPKKREIIDQADSKAAKVLERYQKGEISRDERKQAEVNIWTKATEDVSDDLLQAFEVTGKKGDYNPIYMMAFSGARGNMQQIRQLAAMRGLMSNPHGDILAFPIKSNFREGLNQSEYFISTYGARKGLVDTALRTADSGYLTRRLVDVGQDVVITIPDCKTSHGIEIFPIRQNRSSNNVLVDDIIVPVRQRISGRILAKPILHPVTGKEISVIQKGESIKLVAGLYCSDEISLAIENNCEYPVSTERLRPNMICADQVIDPKTNRIILRPDRPLNEYAIRRIRETGVQEIKVRSVITIRSPLTCRAKSGICQDCYGADMSTGKVVDIGEAVGIIAAQSIGEPGTQLTMRTFHLGGVAVAHRSFIKTRSSGTVDFHSLRLARVSDRTKFEIGSGSETFDKTEFGTNIRTVVVGGHLVIDTTDGKVDRIHIPVGAEMKVEDGDRVGQGKEVAEYNPNHVVTGYTGEVIFENIDQKDGMVVSEKGIIKILTQEFDPVTKDFHIEEYKIPQGATLKVEDNEIIHAGNLLAETVIERRAAISRLNGIAKFENIRVKNKQVISDHGMVFVFPKDTKSKEEVIYNLPKGVKESKDFSLKTGGMVLNVKNGDSVNPGDRLLSVISEIDGKVFLSANGSLIEVSREVMESYEFRGEISAAIDEQNHMLSLKAPISGIVRIINDKSTANKTLDRRRVIIKNEIEYQIPKGVILRPKENCKVPNGHDVQEDGELTTRLTIQSEIDGVVELVKMKSERRIQLMFSEVSQIVNATLARSVVNHDTGETYAEPGVTIDDTLLKIIDDHKHNIREIYLVVDEQESVKITGEEQAIVYPVPQGGVIRVEDGQTVKTGDKLITDVNPIVSDINGKVNYIYGYNKIVCEDIIEKILVYSGVEFNYPASLKVKFYENKMIQRDCELTLEPITFEEYEQLEADESGGGGIKITKKILREKKYRITREMAASQSLLVRDGDDVFEGQTLGVLNSSNNGVVLLDRKISKEGKTRNTIEGIIIRPGEAYQIMDGAELRIEDGAIVSEGEILAKWGFTGKKTTDIIQGLPRVAELFEVRRPKKEAIIAEESGILRISGNSISIIDLNNNEKPVRAQYGMTGLIVHDSEYIEAGDPITDGMIFPKKLAKLVGLQHVQRYLLEEVQRVYRDQGVSINDKHVEIIVRQMLRKVDIVDPGDSDFLPNEMVHVKVFEEKVAEMLHKKKRPPTGHPMIQGITKASLTTDSFISAASFQETTRVLSKAAIKSKVDRLKSLKENLIIGKLIPAGTGIAFRKSILFKNLPAEIEKVDSLSKELFFETPEETSLNKLEEELFIKEGETK
ncbi:hypothetical protein HYY75_04330, partial [bacterium]|nr:hypothetical protein [bacterium]